MQNTAMTIQTWDTDEETKISANVSETMVNISEHGDEYANDISDQDATFDPVQDYLREIGRVPLLSATEEVALAEQIERGEAAAHHLESTEDHSPQMRAALEADIAAGQSARQHLTQANLRLVVSVAKKYRRHNLSLLDLIQEGNLGLMRAVEKFDYRKGYRFSTYATWWIRQAVTRAVANQSRIIRLPVHMGETVLQVKRTVERLTQTLGHKPTTDEIATALGRPVERIEQALKVAQHTLSLETPIDPEGEHTLGDLLSDEALPTVSETATRELLQRDLFAALDILTERERRIIDLRFGLIDGRYRTLEEVGNAMGMTRERARQIESEALRRLRSLETGQHLRDYLE